MFRKLRSWFSNLSGFKRGVIKAGAVITVFGALLAAINSGLDLHERLFGSSLELVDKGFTMEEVEATRDSKAAYGVCERGACSGLSSALDFTVANSSEDSILIKRADIRVKKIWTFRPPYRRVEKGCRSGSIIRPTYMPVSYNYDVELPPVEAPYTLSKSLSQDIGAGKNDRFTITLHPEQEADRAFLIEVAFVYGTDGDVLRTNEMLYGQLSSPAGEDYSYHHFDQCWSPRKGLDESDVARLTRHNKRAVSAIERIEAPRNAELRMLLQTVSGKREYNKFDPDKLIPPRIQQRSKPEE